MRTMIGLLVLLLAASAEAKPLYVNATTGSDSVSYADNAADRPWRTIGRAAWGSTTRGAMNAAEAAQAGDTVFVAGGLYATTATANNRFQSVYHTANTGLAGAPIRFVATGAVRLVAQSANGPVIGAAGRNFIEFTVQAPVQYGWVILNCGRQAGCPGLVDYTDSAPDTGPVALNATTGSVLEGLDVDGGPAIDFRDNYNMVRIEGCTSCVVRQSRFRNIRAEGGGNHNQSAITAYGWRDTTIERNLVENANAGVFSKDTASSQTNQGNVVRANRIDQVNEPLVISHVKAEGSSLWTGNVITRASSFFGVTGTFGSQGDRVVGNTFIGAALAGVQLMNAGSRGLVFERNLFVDAPIGIAVAGALSPAVASFRANFYSAIRTFLDHSGGRQTFEQVAEPGARQGDPELTADHRLAASSPARTVGTARDEVAGAYVTGLEQIGPGGGSAPPPPPTPVDCVPGTERLVSIAVGACVGGTRSVTDTWTRDGDVPATGGGRACTPVVTPRITQEACTMPPPPLTVTATAATRTCDLAATANQPPDSTAGWGVQFSRRIDGDDAWTAHGTRDALGPYTRSAAVPLGRWEVRAVWSRAGAASVTVPAFAVVTCEP